MDDMRTAADAAAPSVDVYLLNGMRARVPVAADLSTRVGSVKECIAALTQIPPHDQLLLFGQTLLLGDERALSTFNVGVGARLDLIFEFNGERRQENWARADAAALESAQLDAVCARVAALAWAAPG